MYCSKCGTKLAEDARFCNKCGTKVEEIIIENGTVVSRPIASETIADGTTASGFYISPKKKKKGVIIAVSAAVVLLMLGFLLVFLTVFGGADKIRVARLCDLGDRYLSEMDYEQAIAAYEAAIEIDPKAEDAYIGLADAYIGLEDYESAVRALERGIRETDSRKLKNYREDVQKEWDDRERRICGTVFLVDMDSDDSVNVGISELCIYLTDQRGEITTYFTDENGYYDTGKLKAGTYSLYFSMDGYVDYRCMVDLNGGRYELDVYLEPDGEQTEENNTVDLSSDEEQMEEERFEEQESNDFGGRDVYPDNGYAEGRIGDLMQTAWFTFTVNSAYVISEYEGYTPADGNELLVVDITIKNTFNESIPMFDTDFQAQWNDTADDAYAWPVEAAYSLSSEILPDKYDLAINESVKGKLLFEVPADNKDFSLSFLEWYEDDTEGNVFFVYFTVNNRR